ncbi:exopolysaccharide Pel transporter PelG [Andreprevotia chitinilytica]|uniref:exopolysaccharide Pel transporter PelG n=1 Tax=Andreprevotia chitinilytica TaxID=396808 RepID=UPI0005557191|nr:exopolysaccharide Pel transporter PelG [Andreprevotia chitinilytica]
MAGIGFELRKILDRDNYASLLQAYAYAGLISAGPWILSIIGVQMIGFLSLSVIVPKVAVEQFQVSVTYLLAASLIVTGPLQLGFTRYIADRLFQKNDEMVLPNFMGTQVTTLIIAAAIGLVLAFTAFAGLSWAYRLLMYSGFVLLCLVWIAAIFLSGLKKYLAVVWLFGIGYGTTVIAALLLRPYGLIGLLGGFVIGHYVLASGLWFLVLRHYPSKQLISIDFLKRGRMYPALLGTGLLYNIGIWLDKVLFWYAPSTGTKVIGPLQASPIYDFPIFLAYLSIIPGMAAFLVRIETDFVEYYNKFYDAVREGGSLDQIETLRNEMVFTIRTGLAEIMKIQGLAILATFMLGDRVFAWLGISPLYLPLLYIDVVAAGLQVALLAILNVFFYLDRRREVLLLSGAFVVTNSALTIWSIEAGPSWYGMGFAGALLIVVCIGMAILNDTLDRLEYETFMLQ